MRHFVAIAGLALSALALAGCKHDRAEAIAASYSSVTKPIPIAVALIPVEEEYEARAAVEITKANLAEQVSALEQELR
jgi:hypothetical protein